MSCRTTPLLALLIGLAACQTTEDAGPQAEVCKELRQEHSAAQARFNALVGSLKSNEPGANGLTPSEEILAIAKASGERRARYRAAKCGSPREVSLTGVLSTG